MIRRGLVTLALLGLVLSLVAVVTMRAVQMKTSLVPDLVDDEPAEAPVERAEQNPSGPVLRVPSPPPERPRQVRLLDRPLVVAGLGWERLAPALSANAGLTPSKASAFAPSGLAVTVRPGVDAAGLVEALARGGEDEEGADVAVVSLPTWVSVHDRVAAVEPVVFYVAGWSGGREGVFEASAVDAGAPEDSPTVRIASGDLDATYLALFGLDLERVPVSGVSLVDEDDGSASTMRAVDLLDLDATAVRPPLRWTTARASRLIPIVMVGSRPWVESHEQALVAWLRGWLFGVGELSGQIAPAARRLSRIEGAPSPLRLMRGLQAWEPSSLSENLALFELDGPSSQTLRETMRRTWSLLHQAHLAGSPPWRLPVHAGIVRSAYLAEVATDVGSASAWRGGSSAAGGAEAWQTVLSRPMDETDGLTLAKELALLQSVYPGAVLQVVPKKKDGPIQTAVEAARDLSSIPQTLVLGDPNPDLPSAGRLDVLVTVHR